MKNLIYILAILALTACGKSDQYEPEANKCAHVTEVTWKAENGDNFDLSAFKLNEPFAVELKSSGGGQICLLSATFPDDLCQGRVSMEASQGACGELEAAESYIITDESLSLCDGVGNCEIFTIQ